MSFPKVLERGDDFLGEMPRNGFMWNYFSQATCMLAVGCSKFALSFYTPKVTGLEKLEAALEKARRENRGFITVMNHMSV